MRGRAQFCAACLGSKIPRCAMPNASAGGKHLVLIRLRVKGNVRRVDNQPVQSQGFRMSTRRALVEFGLIFAGLALAVGLVLKGTGLVASWLTPLLSPELDVAIGKALSQAQRQSTKRCENAELNAYVTSVLVLLTSQLRGSSFRYQVSVVDDDVVNAFALPGGFITLNYGLVKRAQNGEELAAVLAHEIQHVELRHSTRSILRQVGGWTALGVIFGNTTFQVPAYMLANAEVLRASREQEADADRRGFELLQAAKIRPDGFVSFLRRLAAESVVAPEFLSSHPDPGRRAELSQAQLQAHEHQNFPGLAEPQVLFCHE